MKKSYTLCEGTNCPLKESCARYLPDLVRKDTDFYEPIPYDHKRTMPFKHNGKMCGFYEPDETDQIINSIK